MQFNDLLFPLVFLPLSVLLFRLVPAAFKKPALVLCSCLFIAWGSPQDLLLTLLSVVFNYISARELYALRRQGEEKKAKAVFLSAVIADLLFLGYFKYFNFVTSNLGALFKTALVKNTLAVPMGISFFTFSELSFLFDVYRERVAAPGKPMDFALYVLFFPKFGSGPIMQYKDMEEQLLSRPAPRLKTETGVRVFLAGLFKKVLLANTLGAVFTPISSMDPASMSMVTAWIGALSYAFMLYYDFSGYSDMALGIGKIFGVDLPVNFRYPYLSDSVSDFWRRWHASLGAWFRDYVYIPLGGSRGGDLKTVRNLTVVWLLTGIWHGANWTFLIWGVFHGAVIVLEKFVLKNALPRIPLPLRRAGTFLAVLAGWVFFFSPGVGPAFSYLGRMVSVAHFTDRTAGYYLLTALPLLIVSVIGASPVVRNAAVALKRSHKKWFFVAEAAVFALGLGLSIAGMLSDTYSSFLYAQF